MASKKKKKNSSRNKTSQQGSFSSGALASQLSGLKLDPKKDQSKKHVGRVKTPEPAPVAAEEISPEELLDGEDLFLAALDAMPEPSSKQKQRGTSPFQGKFAQQLKGHQSFAERLEGVQVADSDGESEGGSDGGENQSPEPQTTAEPLHQDVPLAGEALFEHALNQMKPTDLFVGKYHGQVKGLPKDKKKKAPFTPQTGAATAKKKTRAERQREEEEARQRVAEVREDMLFSRAVGQLDEVFSGQEKYYKHAPRTFKEDTDKRGYSSEIPEGMITPPLPKTGEGLNRIDELHPEFRGLLNRSKLWARKNQMDTLNLRGDVVEDALRQLELFIHQQWKDGALYVRIVHGKGLQSEDGIPVLKPSILHWLEGPGFRYVRGYAPELTQDRDYGSVVVCLTRKGEKSDK